MLTHMEKLEIEVIRSRRKTMSLEITKDLKVKIRAPKTVSKKRIREFAKEHMSWIVSHIEKMRERQEQLGAVTKLTPQELQELADAAVSYIPGRVAHFAPLLNVTYGRITIRNQQTRWGSCSAKGNLNFNCLLMLTPPEVIDYIVVHELCHRLEMNHSKRFWEQVAKIVPDYKAQEKWLKENGNLIMARNR
ncbi:MAG: M48 family metallopeptidase [Lachnospiraceae bacterium]|nr:M48 family metallopeptidase [Lachnospiraceae bacterium]MCR5267962.1 M48 family metallopeptidase [Lachnospiraceae bacterium]